MGMVGLRDVFFVAPAASFQPPPQSHEQLLPVAEHPIIPLLTAAPTLVDDSHHDSRAGKPAGGIQFWQAAQALPSPHPPPSQNPNPNPNFSSSSYPRKPNPPLILSGAGATTTCQDCGNQAKKDCNHRRCRTCCKSRGFDCSTHVKSTWVPAARRRERQLAVSATAGTAGAAGSSASTSTPKKPRLISSQTTTTSHTSTSTTPPRSFDTSSSHQGNPAGEHLPGHVRAPAIFKCVRVTSIDDGEDEYAYQAMVTIGGHVFKGFLYDQGEEDSGANTHNIFTGAAFPNVSELHLGVAGAGASSSSAVLPSDVYDGAAAASGAVLLGGPAYGNPIN
ncbi:hypothetical protein AXF42_Ash004505 [Apostasia shenzhenica]|uniref:Protein LATERAL ROOT PRIMORDIUM 1 n=1 Tax=Apostasia shenzhenica TaxID=1088818 RepID=A0A2I0BGW6_9ASPA|nr:hypothetical protein AXF42_Ash004505 [Apostasia shenzhenica]